MERIRDRAGRSRDRVAGSQMNIGIDLGTTNSALAYIPEIHGELPDYPEIQVLPIPQYVAPGQMEARRTLPSFLVPGRPNLRRRLCSRTGRAGAHQVGSLGEIVAIESRSGPHRQNSSLGRAGRRARTFAGGCFHSHFVEHSRCLEPGASRTRRLHRKMWCSRSPPRSMKKRAS